MPEESQYHNGDEVPIVLPTDQGPEDQAHQGPVQMQCFTGAPHVKLGYVAIVMRNMPINEVRMPDGQVELAPCAQMSAREAMEIGMNIIHIAKIAEVFEQQQQQKEQEG